MNTRAARTRSTLVALALFAGLGGWAGSTTLAGSSVIEASPSTSITVQDQGNHDGAGVDTDGTQGEFHPAVTGTTTGPLMDAVPQFKAV